MVLICIAAFRQAGICGWLELPLACRREQKASKLCLWDHKKIISILLLRSTYLWATMSNVCSHKERHFVPLRYASVVNGWLIFDHFRPTIAAKLNGVKGHPALSAAKLYLSFCLQSPKQRYVAWKLILSTLPAKSGIKMPGVPACWTLFATTDRHQRDAHQLCSLAKEKKKNCYSTRLLWYYYLTCSNHVSLTVLLLV